MRPSRPALALFAALGLALGSGGCLGAGASRTPPDAQFGHRYEGLAPDGRETLALAVPADTSTYFVYPAVVDSVLVRPAVRAAPPGTPVEVELLLKGTIPDACSELDGVRQARVGRIVEVDLTMRQPRGDVCTLVLRPFRFYLPLEGPLEPGHYTFLVNGAAHPLRIRPVEADPPGARR